MAGPAAPVLLFGSDQKTISANIDAMMRSGQAKSTKQAAFLAYKQARRSGHRRGVRLK